MKDVREEDEAVLRRGVAKMTAAFSLFSLLFSLLALVRGGDCSF